MENSIPKFLHKSVLVNEVLQYLSPQPGKTYVDVTLGCAGHTSAILDMQPTCKVIGLDWDKNSIEQNAPALQEKYGDRINILWGNFAHLYKLLKNEGIKNVDGILADFGTSQLQIREREGLSFLTDTPLDMRMSKSHYHTTAAEILNTCTENEISKILFEYGEESYGRKIARAIVMYRKKEPFKTTGQLVDLIESIIPRYTDKGKRRTHPATKTFQALRIAVNNELENIKSLLHATIPFLAPKGKLVCISFHSLEDRIVKEFFKEKEALLELKILTPKAITACDAELSINPSARSAKLRAAEKV
jgi:16S rRNA (cytosine1402-N4)-methyltransferase